MSSAYGATGEGADFLPKDVGSLDFPEEVRTIDGRENHQSNPELGAAGQPLLRVVPADYTDGKSTPAGENRASARLISNTVNAQSTSIPNAVGATDFLWLWGQFLDHDVTEIPIAVPFEIFGIPVPKGDPMFDPNGTGEVSIQLSRSGFEVDSSGVRQQVNILTSYIDASNVYGSDEERNHALRTNDGTGRLKVTPTPRGDYLPFNTEGLENAGGTRPDLFLAGDVRANEQISLTAMHTLFVREHNYWADQIRNGDAGLSGDEVYEKARVIVSAEMQAITYREFLPLLLGEHALSPYQGFSEQVDPTVSNIFSAAAYRVGHTMLSSNLLLRGPDGEDVLGGSISLKDAFFRPDKFAQFGMEPILKGIASQASQAIDTRVIDDVRNFLFDGQPGGFDLASLNIQRGRDHGLPDFNSVRRFCGLPALSAIDQYQPFEQGLNGELAKVYRDENDIDAWVGLLGEKHVPGALVGETLQAVLADQFTRLRDGDRFWYQNYLNRDFQKFIEKQTLATIIVRNTEISNIQRDVFLLAGAANPSHGSCEVHGDITDIDFPSEDIRKRFERYSRTHRCEVVHENCLLKNGSFEKGLEGWDIWGDVEINSGPSAYDGSQAARLSRGLLVQSVDVTGGEEYQLHGKAKASGELFWSEVSIAWFDQSGSEIFSKNKEMVGSTDGFKAFHFPAKAPANAERAVIAIWSDNTNFEANSLQVDSLSFCAKGGDGGGEEPTETDECLLVNPSFEKGLEGWDTWNSVAIEMNENGGKFAALEYSLLAQAVNVKAGASYRITGKMRSTGTPDWLQWAVTFYDDQGLEIETESSQIADSTDWVSFAGDLVAPEGAKVGLVNFWAGQGGKLLLDDLCFSTKGDDGGETDASFDIRLSDPSAVDNGVFSFQVSSSEPIDTDATTIGPASFDVANGSITGVASLGLEYRVMAAFAEGATSLSITFRKGVAKSTSGKQNAVSNTLNVTREIDPEDTGGGNIEGSQFSINSGEAIAKEFDQAFVEPVVFASILASGRPAIIRISDVDSSGYDIEVVPLDGGPVLEGAQVYVKVFEAGVYQSAKDGVTMEIGIASLSDDSSYNAWNGFENGTAAQVTLQNSYSDAVVISQLQTANNQKWSQGFALPVSSDNKLKLGHHTGEAPDTWRPDSEQIGYIVIEKGSGSFQGDTLVAGSLEVDSSGKAITTDGQVAGVLATQNGNRDIDGGFASIEAIGNDAVKIGIKEDQLNDNEMEHAAEKVDYVIFK